MRYFLEVSYKGTAYHGWQVQPNAKSVQEILNTTLSTILREKISVQGSGRTDTAVHCLQQFAHFDVEKALELPQMLYKINGLLPHDIAIRSIKRVKEEAHARFSAYKRTYIYKINQFKNAFEHDRAWHLKKEVDYDVLEEAAQAIKQFEDFTAFSKRNVQVTSHVCQISESSWQINGESLVYTVSANRFLRGMVRIIVGNMVAVATGKISLAKMKESLERKSREDAHILAPPQGLYLKRVEYPEHIWV